MNVDVSTIYNGYYADASRMFMIGKVAKPAADLVAITKQCLLRGIEAAQLGVFWEISELLFPSWHISMAIPLSKNSAATALV